MNKSLENADNTGRVTLSAVLTALAMIFSYLEAVIPIAPGIPGIKLGLANIMIVIALYTLGTGYALTINLVRIVLTAIMFGNPFSLIYSLAGSTLSLIGMVLMKKTDLFSITGVSMAGGVLHNAGQLAAAAVFMPLSGLIYYLPVLTAAGVVTGAVNGILSYIIIRKSNRWLQYQ